jgi:hypothetical protein
LRLCFCTKAKKEKRKAKKSVAFVQSSSSKVLPGAYQVKEYLPMLAGKRVGLFANHTSTIAGTHLVDTLQNLE